MARVKNKSKIEDEKNTSTEIANIKFK